jgi:hypothetical protein
VGRALKLGESPFATSAKLVMLPGYACHSESNATMDRAPAGSYAAHRPRAWAQASSYQSNNLLRGVSDKENSNISGWVAEEDMMMMNSRMDVDG